MIGRLTYELQEILSLRLRYVIYVLSAVALVLLSGWLVEGPAPVNVIVFTDGMAAEESQQLARTVALVPSATVVLYDGSLDAETLRRNDAVLGIGMVLGRITALENSASSQDGYLGAFLRSLPHLDTSATSNSSPFNAVATLATILAVPESANVLVDAGRRPFLPAMIALLALFAPFLIALETYARQRASGLLLMSIAADRGHISSATIGRLVTSVLGGMVVLLVMLAVAREIYGVGRDVSWPQVALWYLPAALFSASVGSVVGLSTGGQRVLGSSAGYLFALVIFGGLFAPLAAAAPIVQWISLAVPTRYFMPVLRRWMFEGQVPTLAILPDLTSLQLAAVSEMRIYIGIALASVLVLIVAAVVARRRY